MTKGSALPPGMQALVRVSAALAGRERARVEQAMRDAAVDADQGEVEEVILQSYLFLGYPAALNGFALWREIAGKDAAPASEDEPGSWEERGAGVCRAVYGDQYPALRENIRALHPDLERWMVREGYGKVLGRPGLALPRRELCIAALLAVLDTPKQLYSHLRGALNAGATREEVEAMLDIVDGFMPEEGRRSAREVWGEVITRGEERTSR